MNFKTYYQQFLESSNKDEQYLSAVEAGDVETVQRMVDSAAKTAGYNYMVYHGTYRNFNSFDPDKYLTDRDQYSGPGINTTTSKDEASKYGSRVIEGFVKSENPATIKYHVFELLTNKERQEAESALEESVNIISRRLIDGSIEPYGSIFIIKSKSRLDLGFLNNPPFKGKIDSKEKAFQVFNLISNGSVSDLHYSVKPNQDKMTSYGSMNRKIIEILKKRGYDSIVMKIRDDDALHAGFASEHRTVFDPNQIKLADPVTYSDNGNVIPLSSRFDSTKDDIRY